MTNEAEFNFDEVSKSKRRIRSRASIFSLKRIDWLLLEVFHIKDIRIAAESS